LCCQGWSKHHAKLAVFVNDPATGTYRPATQSHKPPQGNDAKCGLACHTIVKGKDYVFTRFAQR